MGAHKTTDTFPLKNITNRVPLSTVDTIFAILIKTDTTAAQTTISIYLQLCHANYNNLFARVM
jgi:hypothetical protein